MSREERRGKQVVYRESGRGCDRPERESMGNTRPGRKQGSGSDRSKGLLLVLSILFLAALVAAIYFYCQGGQDTSEQVGLVYEVNIIEGDIPGKSRKDIQRELDEIVEEGMLAVSINTTPSRETTGENRNVNQPVESPPSQGKLIRVEVFRDGTGEKIYETGVIPPGNYVEAASLKVELPSSQYTCTARFHAYKVEDKSYIGQAVTWIRLTLYE